jgi:galactitol-specific phosphotransferase system IIB component
MKKLLAGLFACVCVFVMAACGGAGANTPTAVAENYLSDLKAGNYEALVDQLYFKQEMSDTDKEQLVVMCKGKVEQTIEKNGELKGWEITSEEIAEDGQKAVVKYTLKYENKDVEDKVKLINVDGEWKVNSGK